MIGDRFSIRCCFCRTQTQKIVPKLAAVPMARMNLLDTRTTSFGDLISNGKIYRVPPFQRDYSWTEENWEDLWQDIAILHANLDASHYMGAIVLQNSGTADKEFTIIDGQQRLATLSIITIAVINKIQQLVVQGKILKPTKSGKKFSDVPI